VPALRLHQGSLGARLVIAPSLTDRRAWLEWRRGGIGASDAAAIAGLDPFKGAMSIWLDKTHRLPLDDDDAEYRRWGNLLEPAIAEEFEKRTGLHVTGRGELVEHPEHKWMRSTIDGFVCESGEPWPSYPALGALEIKTVAGFKSKDWAEQVPDHFQLQVQHQLAVTGLQHAWLAVLFGGQRMEIRELERDEELIDSLLELEDAFWTKHVLADVPPSSDGYEATTEDLRRAFAGGGGETVILPSEAETLIAQRAEAKDVMKAAEKSCAEAEQALMALLGDAEIGLRDGRPRVTWKRFERSTIDLETFRNQHPLLAAQLTVKSSYRRFSVVGGKEETST